MDEAYVFWLLEKNMFDSQTQALHTMPDFYPSFTNISGGTDRPGRREVFLTLDR